MVLQGRFGPKKGCFWGTKCAVSEGHLPTWPPPHGVTGEFFGSKVGFGKGTTEALEWLEYGRARSVETE